MRDVNGNVGVRDLQQLEHVHFVINDVDDRQASSEQI